MSLAYRPPSYQWEFAPVPDLPQCAVWTWVRPANSPMDVLIRIPPEVHQRLAGWLTPRRLLAAVGGQPADVESWVAGGLLFSSGGENVPTFDQAAPLPAADPQIVFRLRAPLPIPAAAPTFPSQSNPPPGAFPMGGAAAATGGDAERVFQAIEGDWQAIELLDTQLASVRKQLAAQQGKLQSLNRDLNADERVAADTLDKKDWQDARRWLRDCAAQVSRYIRDHDIGFTSAAGKRNVLEQYLRDYVTPRQAGGNLSAIQQEFEVYRKTAQVLLTAMQSASSAASRDGEQRAQQILTRIAAKTRSRSKRS